MALNYVVFGMSVFSMAEGHFHISLGQVTKERIPSLMRIERSLAKGQTHPDS